MSLVPLASPGAQGPALRVRDFRRLAPKAAAEMSEEQIRQTLDWYETLAEVAVLDLLSRGGKGGG